MIARRGAIRLAGLAAIIVMVGLMSMWTSSVKAQPSPCTPGVDCDNGMSASDEGPAAVGANVDVDISIDYATTGYVGLGGVLEYDSAIVNFVPVGTKGVVYTGLGGMSAGAVANDIAGVGTLRMTKFGPYDPDGIPSTDTGVAVIVRYQCVAKGTTDLRLVPPAAAIDNSTTLAPGGVRIATGLVAGSIECENQADVQTVKDAPPMALAGDIFDYVVTVHNAGPNPATGVVIGDNLPETIPDDPAGMLQKELVDFALEYNAAPIPCVPGYLPMYVHPVTAEVMYNIVLCDLASAGHPVMAVSDTAVLTLTVEVPLWDAGKLNVNTAQGGSLVTPDPDESNEADCAMIPGLPDGNIGCAFTQVLPSDISIVKSADRDPAVYSENEEILWDIEATVNGPSPASDVVLFDEVGPNQEMTYCFALVTPPPPDMVWPCTCVIGDADTDTLDDCTCDCTGLPIGAGGFIGMAVDADVVGSAGNLCVDDVEVCWADPLCASVHAEAVCLPPTTRMEKDIDEDAVSIVDVSNLFLEIDPATGDLECLTIYELVSNAGNDPDGIGAYEFQLKFDHKIFDIVIEDSSWLSNGGARTVDCTMTIISESDIRFGCVSSGPVPGQTSDGTAAIITVCPEPDLVNRLTPGQENGVVRTLLDENCELADVLGDPLQLADGTLAPGVLPGGILAVCSDFTITVRILEADLNLDCVVDVLDEQAIAFRYGAFFGNLLYDPWYDLEPALKDFDIDIKDLQKVFGRHGSECLNPIPPQDPFPAPPW